MNGRRPVLNLDRILVPTDFSDISLAAIDYGREIARRAGAREVILFHAIEGYEYNVALGGEKTISEAIKKGITDKLEEIRREKLGEVPSRVLVTEGKFYRTLEKVVVDEGIGLIVMGTHGASSVFESPSRYFLGSNAYRVVYAIPCPVITIRKPKETIDFKTVVLPLDVTKETTQKVGIAIQWAKIFGSTIHAISVTSFTDEYFHDLYRLEWVLKQVVREIEDEGINVVTHVLRFSRVAHAVIQYAESVNADLIMIMTRQERKWNELFLGSAARTVIERSSVPVMSIKPLPPEMGE